ncbi:MAG: type II/IV secretion system ATPase subunit [Candidatus Aenigmarchaeota archaeon]|nr:type II/IV secretion system ATPase subunit [Candidatus Aenigmarchaeota archaeon]
MTAGEYTYDEESQRLRIDWLGSIYGASIEDYEECMAVAIDKILEVKKVKELVIAKDREYEYDEDQVEILKEIAVIMENLLREKFISVANLGGEACSRYYPALADRLHYIVIELLRKDPVGAYVETIREMRNLKVKLKTTTNHKAQECFEHYIDNVFGVLKERFEKTKLIQLATPHLAGFHLGDRSVYREIFMPIIRPNFMLTRYMMTPPEEARSVDRYKVGDITVEIFKLQKSAEFFYFVTPPEFKLAEDKYSVLDSARRYMASHKPKSAEFVRSEKVREVFFNIGRDMIHEVAGQMGVSLSGKELEQLATILTRYTAGLGVLEVLLNDDRIQDIYINSPIETQTILINHSDYEECRTNLIPTQGDAESWATRLRIQSGRPLDEANPVLDTDVDVPGGSARFAIITRTLSPYGLGFAIRRHRDKPWTLPLFIKNKTISPLASGLLSFMIDGSVSMLLAGGRGAGKSSILGALMLELMPKTRICTIEDTLELPVMQLIDMGYNIARMKSRSVITRVETEMPADEALRTALRLGDSALIMGEVRSTEAKTLYEAMRIGALSNVVAGTIHGESAYGVFDRVVNDLEVPKTSFKATDLIPIIKTLRSADGLHRFRRMTEITEVRKHWTDNPLKEGGFINLMEYSSKTDSLEPTDTLVNGESEILNRISSYVKEWSTDWNAVWENIRLRAKIKQTIVDYAEKLKSTDTLEAIPVVKANSMFHVLQEQVREEVGATDPKIIFERWHAWYKEQVKK